MQSMPRENPQGDLFLQSLVENLQSPKISKQPEISDQGNGNLRKQLSGEKFEERKPKEEGINLRALLDSPKNKQAVDPKPYI